MPNCTATQVPFGKLGRREIDVRFDGGDVTSDGGFLLLRQVEQRLGLLKAVAQALPDTRQSWLVQHTTEQMLRQRVFGLCQGNDDLNDRDRLRDDLAMQMVVGKDQAAASSPTLCRFENRADRATAVAMQRVLVEKFIASFPKAPEELVLDFDATDDLVHSEQEGRHFSGYYDNYCFLPLYVFCGEQLLVSYLRPAKLDAALHTAAILKLLATRLRQAWPGVRIIFRSDSGFCRPHLMSWCERNHVYYVITGKGARHALIFGANPIRQKVLDPGPFPLAHFPHGLVPILVIPTIMVFLPGITGRTRLWKLHPLQARGKSLFRNHCGSNWDSVKAAR